MMNSKTENKIENKWNFFKKKEAPAQTHIYGGSEAKVNDGVSSNSGSPRASSVGIASYHRVVLDFEAAGFGFRSCRSVGVA